MNWFSSVGDALGVFMDWFFQIGSTYRIYGPGSDQVNDLQSSPGVTELLRYYCEKKKKCGASTYVTHFDFDFEKHGGPFLAGVNPTQQLVGSFSANAYTGAGNDVLIEIYNTTSMQSFLFDRGPEYERTLFSFGGNLKEKYWWYQFVDCSKF